MSAYDDDSERLGDKCDGCGRPFFLCDCEEEPDWQKHFIDIGGES